jgi:hypothetical protein
MDLMRFLDSEERVDGYERLEDVLARAFGLGLKLRGPSAAGRSPQARRGQTSTHAMRFILKAAYDQAARGKGKERHACDRPWTMQPIFLIPKLLSCGVFNLGQAVKKLDELQRLPHERARAEALGAIVYLASAVVLVDEARDPWEAPRGWAEPGPPIVVDEIIGQLARGPLAWNAVSLIHQAALGCFRDESEHALLNAILYVVRLVDAMDAQHAGDLGG